MSTRSLDFPNASPGFLAMNAHLLGGAGLPKVPTPAKPYTPKVDMIPSELAVYEAGVCRFTIPGEPISAPRQSRCDAWRPRECVIRYREWKDKARACAPADMPLRPVEVRIKAFMAVKPSWSKKKQAAMAGQPHRVKIDWDNCAKAVCDALWAQDSCIASGSVEKRWCWAGEERIEVTILP